MRKNKKIFLGKMSFLSDPFINLTETTLHGANPNSDTGLVTYVDVLDCGHVSYVDHMGTDLTVVNAARVSFSKESTWIKKKIYDYIEEADEHVLERDALSDRDKKLISYLAEHNHWTPFGHPQVTIRIKTPIFIRAQLGKHQVGLVMNEISRRYVTYEPEYYTPAWRTAPTDGAKQGSSSFMFDTDSEEKCKELDRKYESIVDSCHAMYNELIEMGVAPEQARSILPQNMYTEWWWTGSLYAFSRIYNQRIEIHSQWEAREYARAIGQVLSSLFPVSWKALTKKA